MYSIKELQENEQVKNYHDNTIKSNKQVVIT